LPELDAFCRGKTIASVTRRAKYILVHFTDQSGLILHLGMTGCFIIDSDDEQPTKHERVRWLLSDGRHWRFCDVRGFGSLQLCPKGTDFDQHPSLAKLGIEPLSEAFTGQTLKKLCRLRKTAIKPLIMDQAHVVGIGNIYANEICFRCGLDPLRKSCYISVSKWDEVIEATREVLRQAIEQGGTTIRSYTSSLGVTGLFQQSLMVHAREKESCYCCGSEIIKIRVNGRGTYYCPVCQRRKPLVVAVTGCIGSGKSEVSSYLKERGYLTISSDEINADLLKQPQTIADLAAILGCQKEDIDKKYLSEVIFSQSAAKEKVESYLHQRIYQEIASWIKENEAEKLLFVEVPLLYEVGWDRYFDYNVNVDSRPELIYQRLLENRKMKKEEVDRRLRNQLSLAEKAKRADYNLDNRSTLEKLHDSIETLIRRLEY
ncbi:MAG TPA: bifunctional DNA-formamidopyrimidine glycosylase/DNA-(apurinic or apyrimidinic site) lyase, partial [Erysipelotrichaceae bacterium]|nr:bifunctional DNA-formamidopyrimidine glycosylase/DNA-(apurinic or apyrimidinic site) lyase [Erysipelotrichaceae bacterium]